MSNHKYDYFKRGTYECNEYSISTECLQSSPCFHYVRNNKTGEISCMGGIDLCIFIMSCSKRCSHFDGYKTYSPSFERGITWGQMSWPRIKKEDLYKYALVVHK